MFFLRLALTVQERYWFKKVVFAASSRFSTRDQQEIQPIVIKKANQFASIKFRGVQLLFLLNIFGGATRLDSILKAYNLSKKENYFTMNLFENPEKLNKTQPSTFEAFFSSATTNALKKTFRLSNIRNRKLDV